MKRFEDKTILVTGAGSGIGAACVRRLFAEGASIAAADVRKEEVDKASRSSRIASGYLASALTFRTGTR